MLNQCIYFRSTPTSEFPGTCTKLFAVGLQRNSANWSRKWLAGDASLQTSVERGFGFGGGGMSLDSVIAAKIRHVWDPPWRGVWCATRWNSFLGRGSNRRCCRCVSCGRVKMTHTRSAVGFVRRAVSCKQAHIFPSSMKFQCGLINWSCEGFDSTSECLAYRSYL